MTLLKNIRAYIRPVATYSEAKQREAVDRAVAKLSLPVAYYVETKAGTVRDAWLRALRSDEVAIVSRLDMLAGPRKLVGRPMVDLTHAISMATSSAAYLVDAERGIASNDRKRWPEVLSYTANRVVQGRRLTPAKARAMAEKSHEDREPGIVDRWRNDPGHKAQRDLWGSVWRDVQKYPNATAAVNAMPAEIASVATAYRIWGARVPKRKRR